MRVRVWGSEDSMRVGVVRTYGRVLLSLSYESEGRLGRIQGGGGGGADPPAPPPLPL